MIVTESVVYADMLFLVNFSMDYITLYLTCRLTSAPPMRWRAVLSAAIGGLYGTLSVVWNTGGISGALMTVAVSALLVLIAFGRLWRRLFAEPPCSGAPPHCSAE